MQVHSDGSRWVVRLEEGHELLTTLAEFAQTHGMKAAIVVSGIGMLRSCRVGFWNGTEYEPRELNTPHELVGLHGSIAEFEAAPSVHVHVALAGRDHALVGGHLLEGTVGAVAEVYLEQFEGARFGRRYDPKQNLRLLDLEHASAPG
ncbi:MAG: DNA-binding protein [Thermoplasmata archaeon]|nr:DNA-binding protein [Thermoplasmata archaeon]